MNHRFNITDNQGVKVALRNPGEQVELRGFADLTADWNLRASGVTTVDTSCVIYCYAEFVLNGYKLKYFGIPVDDKYANQPHKVTAYNTRNVWRIEVSLISLVGGPAPPDPGSPSFEYINFIGNSGDTIKVLNKGVLGIVGDDGALTVTGDLPGSTLTISHSNASGYKHIPTIPKTPL